MVINLDLRSLAVMAGLMGMVLGLVLFGLQRNYPASIKGLRAWASAPLLCAASTVFYGLDGVLPAALAALGGNALLLGGSALFYFGSQRFYGQAVAWRLWGGLIVLCLLAIAWFMLGQPDYRVRVGLFALTMAALLIQHLRLLLARGRGFAARFTALVLGLQAAVLLLRGATIGLDAGSTASRFDPTLLQSAYVAAFSFSVLLISVGVVLMASERLRLEFEHIASHDTLTGALSRRALLESCQHELERCRRYGRPAALLILDIDHFKAVNDQHGHLVGDRVLKEVVGAVRQALRQTDRIGRYGGEEFVVLLPETDRAAALAAAERMRLAVAQRAGEPRCTTSIGLACLQPDETSTDALLARADAALYRAKAQGRNRVEPG